MEKAQIERLNDENQLQNHKDPGDHDSEHKNSMEPIITTTSNGATTILVTNNSVGQQGTPMCNGHESHASGTGSGDTVEKQRDMSQNSLDQQTMSVSENGSVKVADGESDPEPALCDMEACNDMSPDSDDKRNSRGQEDNHSQTLSDKTDLSGIYLLTISPRQAQLNGFTQNP